MANIFQRVITLVFGALPATSLVIVGVILLSYPLAAVGFTSDPATFLLVILPSFTVMIFGILGTTGLWITVLGPDPISTKTAIRLMMGICALLLFLALMWPRGNLYLLNLSGPIFVAGWHLWRWRAATRQCAAATDEEIECTQQGGGSAPLS